MLNRWITQYARMAGDVDRISEETDEFNGMDTSHRSIEPGDPQLEHVVFVFLGVIATIVVFLRGLGFL